MARMLVTGGAGFIGSHLVDALVRAGDQVCILDDFSTGNPANLAAVQGSIAIIKGDVADAALVARAVDGVDTVFHLAAVASVQKSIQDPLRSHQVNTLGTLNVLQAACAQGARRVIFAASAAAYGDQPGDAKHEGMAPEPLSPYAATKLAGEHYCAAFARSMGLETVALRFFNVFGPRQDPKSDYAPVIPLFATKLIAGEAPTIFGDGRQSRDFIYVANVVHALHRAAQVPALGVTGQVFNVGAGVPITLLELLAALNRHLGTTIAPILADARLGDIRHSRADISKAQRLLGYEVQVSFDDGVRQTLDWYKNDA